MKGKQVKVNLPLEDETEKERPHLPLAPLPRRTGALGMAARRWRRKPAGGTTFPKSNLELDAISARAPAATVSERLIGLHHRNPLGPSNSILSLVSTARFLRPLGSKFYQEIVGLWASKRINNVFFLDL